MGADSEMSRPAAESDEYRWSRMLDYARRARSSPAFDAKEREYRLAVAAEVRRILELAVAGEPWLDDLRGLTSGMIAGRAYDVTERSHQRWLPRLSRSEAFGRALGCFMDPELDPVGRFEAFLRAVAEDRPAVLAPVEEIGNPDAGKHDEVLAVGSLFNFACAPAELPVVRPRLYDRLEQSLGYEWTYRLPLADQYRRHLTFAADVKARLAAADIPVRDMLDVQSLIQDAGEHADFWTSDPRRRDDDKPYLSICAIYRDEAPYLREWIEFHRLAGVERFFLYDNLSEDDHLEVLAPYLADGTVTVRRWPVFDPQVTAYNDCLRWHRYDSRWIAFIDVDEFLFSPTGQPLPEVLADYEAWPGVAVAWVMYGTGGHRTRPEGLVVENYLRTIPQPDPVMNMKSIVDPTRTTNFISGHHCAYPYLSAVDENQFPVDGHTLLPPSFARLRLNHYHCKSEEEFVAKFDRWREIGRRRKVITDEELERVRAYERESADDAAILQFVPALRAALSA